MAHISGLLIGLMIFSGMIMGMSVFYTDLTSPTNLQAYGMSAGQIANISPQDIRSIAVTNETVSYAKEIEAQLNQQPTGIEPLDVAWGYVNLGLNALFIPLRSVNLFTVMVEDTSEYIGLPPWVGLIAIGIVTILIILQILSIYVKGAI